MYSDLPGHSIPLSRAALCSNCEQVFTLSDRACPKCGGEAFCLLSRLLGSVKAQDELLVLSRGTLVTLARRRLGSSSMLAGRMATEIAKFQQRKDAEQAAARVAGMRS